jgi:hypothetical protein
MRGAEYYRYGISTIVFVIVYALYSISLIFSILNIYVWTTVVRFR